MASTSNALDNIQENENGIIPPTHPQSENINTKELIFTQKINVYFYQDCGEKLNFSAFFENWRGI